MGYLREWERRDNCVDKIRDSPMQSKDVWGRAERERENKGGREGGREREREEDEVRRNSQRCL